jgi:hypothetical protein
VAQQLQPIRREGGLHIALDLAITHSHQVFLGGGRILADQLPGHTPVLRQHQKPHRIDVQPTRHRQPAQLAALETARVYVAGPAALRIDQRHCRTVAVLGLAAHITHRLVQQDRHLVLLQGTRCLPYLHHITRHHLLPHLHRPAVDPHPATGNPVIRLAPRAHPRARQMLVQPFALGRDLA